MATNDSIKTARPTRRFATAEELAKLTSPEKVTFELTDKTTTGLRLRCQPSGKAGWVFAYFDANKKVHRIQIGPYPVTGTLKGRRANLNEARAKALALATEAADQDRPDPHERLKAQKDVKAEQEAAQEAEVLLGDWTVRKLAATYIEALTKASKRPRTISEIERQMRAYVLPKIGDVPAHELTLDQVVDVLVPTAAEGKARQANAVMTTLVGLYTWATGSRKQALPIMPPKHLRGTPNPAQAVQVFEQQAKRERRPLSDAELRTLWATVNQNRGDVYADALTLLMACGTRASETCGAAWSEIDLDADLPVWAIDGKRTKNGKTHMVLLAPAAVAMLRERKGAAERGATFVFAIRKTDAGHARHDTLLKKMKEWLSAAGIEDPATAHELRHNVGTFCSAQGFGEPVRRRVLNHTAPDKVGQGYDHHKHDAEAGEVWRRWAAHLDALTGNSGGKVVPISARAKRS